MVIELFIVIFLAVLIDLTLGEVPGSIHPVVWMGKLTGILKNHFISNSKTKNIFLGVFMTLFLIFIFNLIFSGVLLISSFNYGLFLLLASFLLSTTFAIKSLIKSVQKVGQDLHENLEKARISISFLVSRNTSQLSSADVASAAIETLTENITDSVIAPLFYIAIFSVLGIFSGLTVGFIFGVMESTYFNQLPVLLGVSAGVSYRVVNTLDAMVGYKDPEHVEIGWFPAKTDDYLNYIPARLTGFLIILSSFLIGLNYKNAWQVMLSDAQKTPSPNSGYSMAAAAGALDVQLIKPGVYTLGNQNADMNSDKINDAIKLAMTTITIFLLIIFIIFLC
ncbi:cobalamin biosynthesis protein [Methanobacterium ferruginis]|uniref:cobalamin biosynthesis protein n=1 Tax=Methanobacterium ferruginis TaxID=710191 RepID=UPI002572DD03|nr:cobalamin biosynthesis protein [Methanobacterium ferruginis]BDZ67264.1 cobalamin biosynthesis protein CobD [Methanobacterium ferruginis]